MNEHINLGRIAGIHVGANWSVLVVLWLIAWSLAAEQLPVTYPGHSTSAYWAVGVVTAVVFLASLLAHELGHALVATHNGVGVERITLWLFGGVAMLRGEAADARTELRIAVVGPAVSISLAVGYAAVAGFLDASGAPTLMAAAAAWLAFINLVLAVFNLIPAAPLDGGRVLRALLWMRHGDRLRATQQASAAGRGFGYLLVGLGIVELTAGAGLSGLWLVFLGWFLLSAASAEASHALLRQSLAGVTVGQVMTPNPITAPDDIDVATLLEAYVLTHRASAFPLLDRHGTFCGLVTLARLKEVPAARRRTTAVLDIACPAADVPTVRPDEPLVDLLDRMAGGRDGRAVVLVDGRIVGIVTPTDISRIVELTALRSG
ncbi:MAG: site-2 protease family protein [Acidimicrobiales bacterium]|nr:site-2 protease family protein [Acidimicrobiales bacterium]